MEMAYKIVCWPVLLLLAAMLFACLIRAVKGPRMADRIVAVNMMGTMVMVIIAIMSFLLKESYLVDICLIYASKGKFSCGGGALQGLCGYLRGDAPQDGRLRV